MRMVLITPAAKISRALPEHLHVVKVGGMRSTALEQQ